MFKFQGCVPWCKLPNTSVLCRDSPTCKWGDGGPRSPGLPPSLGPSRQPSSSGSDLSQAQAKGWFPPALCKRPLLGGSPPSLQRAFQAGASQVQSLFCARAHLESDTQQPGPPTQLPLPPTGRAPHPAALSASPGASVPRSTSVHLGGRREDF